MISFGIASIAGAKSPFKVGKGYCPGHGFNQILSSPLWERCFNVIHLCFFKRLFYSTTTYKKQVEICIGLVNRLHMIVWIKIIMASYRYQPFSFPATATLRCDIPRLKIQKSTKIPSIKDPNVHTWIWCIFVQLGSFDYHLGGPLMVLRNLARKTHLRCIKPCKSWDKLPSSTGDRWILPFLCL